MAASAFNVSIVFKTDIEAAQAGIARVKAELGAVAPVTGQATAATTAHVVALEKDAAAADRAAKAQATLAAEARKAQEQLRRTGTAPATLPSYSAIPDPAPRKVPVGVPANTPAPQPSSAPAPGMSEQEKQSIRDRFVPLHAATRDYQSQLEELKRAKAEGVLTDKQVETAQSQITKAYEKTSESVRREQAILEDSNRVIRLQAYERRNLNFQISDTVQTLALGMPPQMVLLQQGPQIIDIYGGVGNTMRAAAQAFTLTRIAVAGAAGAALLGIKAYSDYLASTKEVETAAHGLGRSVAGSASEMEAAAQAGAAAAGISVTAARSMQAAFLRTGKIAHENYAGIIAISKDFAATMGIDADAASDALAKMFSDPAKAAADLGSTYGMLDAATVERIRNLTAQNRLQEAQSALLDGMKGKLASSTEAVTALGRAWNGVKTASSDAFNWMGRTIDRALSGPSLEEQITEQEARVARARNISSIPMSGIARVQSGNVSQEEAKLEALRAQLSARREQDAKSAQNQREIAAWDIARTSGGNASTQRIQGLRNEVATLQGGLSDASGLDPQQQSAITEAIAIRTRMIEALTNSQARAVELDQLDIRIQTERNPLVRANLEAERTRLQLQEEDVSSGKIEIDAKRAYTRVLEEAVVTAQESAVQMTEEIDVRNRLSVLVASGVVKSEDANRLLRDELTLRPLIAAAAAAEGEQKTQLLSTIDQLRAAMDRQAASEKALESATAARQKLKDQTRTLDQLRLEQSLIGQTEQTRQRVLAQAAAEADIRQAGIGVNDTLARQIRTTARETADLTLEVNRQADAWDNVRGASEGAIDAMIDGALSGNLKDGMQGIMDEVKGLWSDLALKNPLKNAMLGTNYATLDDAGGISGIWNRLMGGPEPLSVTASSKSMTTPMMTVQAGTVTIAGGAAGLLGMTGGINTFGGTLGGSADVQKQIWDFLDGKGLKDFQIAGIMGNIHGESRFDPLAVGDNGNAFGLAQWNDRAPALFNHIGGQGNLGDVQGQLEFMWRELMTSESGAMRQLLGSRNVGEATTAFMTGFERPADMSSLNTRLAAADQALATFGSTTTQATQGLGTLGTGFDTFGTSLAQLISGGAVTGQSLLSSGLSMAGTLVASLPGFLVGGETGGNDPSKIAGVVHQQEFVFDAAATRRIGPANLEALRRGKLAGYLTGGYVASAPVPSATASAAPTAPAPVIQIIDQTSGQHTVQTEEYTDARGQRQQRYVLSDAVGDGLSAPGGKAQRALRTGFGVSRPGRLRP